LPSAEFSVLGAPWSDGTKHVYVTLPTDPELAEFGNTATPIVAHWSDPERSGGAVADSRVDTDAGTITAAVTHLSVLDSISQGVSWVFEPLAGLLLDARFPAPSCDGSWSLDTGTGSWTTMHRPTGRRGSKALAGAEPREPGSMAENWLSSHNATTTR
jgi:hypothetical protein